MIKRGLIVKGVESQSIYLHRIIVLFKVKLYYKNQEEI